MGKMIKHKTFAAVLSLLFLVPTVSNAQVMRGGDITLISTMISLLKEEVAALVELLNLQSRHLTEKNIAAVFQHMPPNSLPQNNDCRTDYKLICPLSPFGTQNEPPIEHPTSTIPQFTIKFVTVSANLATIDYSISDIRDNQTAYWVNYGASSSTLDSSTPKIHVSYGITNRHGIDDAAFVIGFPPEEICIYPEIDDEARGDTPLYQLDPPTYYFRIEARNNLGTFFTPPLDLPPFSFQFDNMCGEETYYYEHGAPID